MSIGDGLRSRKDTRRSTEVGVAVNVLNRMLEAGRPVSVALHKFQMRSGLLQFTVYPCNTPSWG
jgi:hypothetical protein